MDLLRARLDSDLMVASLYALYLFGKHFPLALSSSLEQISEITVFLHFCRLRLLSCLCNKEIFELLFPPLAS